MTRLRFSRSERAFVLLLAAVGLIAAAPSAVSSASPSIAVLGTNGSEVLGQGPVLLPVTGAWFGAREPVNQHTQGNRQSALEAFEALVGRKMAVERVYYSWDAVWPNAYDYWSRDQGRTLAISWAAGLSDGTVIKWADIAAGLYDDVIDARARDIKAFGASLIFIFHHEPGIADPSGTPAEFADAFRHLHDRFAADRVANVSYAMVLTSFAYNTNGDLFYPGDRYVDILGADGYNFYHCGGHDDSWLSFQTIFSSFYNYGISKGKPMFVAEWSSDEDAANPPHKGQWITQAALTLKLWPQVKALSWFDNGDATPGCDWWVDSSPATLVAFKAMGADPYFNPPLARAPKTDIAAYVSAIDNSFTQPAGYPTQGRGVEWLFGGPSDHTATDSSGMGYFDSKQMPPGTKWLFTFIAAGIYDYECTLHPSMSGSVKVPMVVTPTTGHVNTTFTVTWATGGPPRGFVYDVQISRPGEGWTSWKVGTTSLKASFVPDGGSGTYAFHARLRNEGNGSASRYSRPFQIQVT